MHSEHNPSPPTDLNTVEFRECAACAAKPGFPALCVACLHNRLVITTLREVLVSIRTEVEATLGRAPAVVESSPLDPESERCARCCHLIVNCQCGYTCRKCGSANRSAGCLKCGAITSKPRAEQQTVPDAPKPLTLGERSARFNDTTGALTWNYCSASMHPDRCQCQEPETTPHKHHDEPPYECARCKCEAYKPAVSETLRVIGRTSDGTPVSETRGEPEPVNVADHENLKSVLMRLREVMRVGEGESIVDRATALQEYADRDGADE